MQNPSNFQINDEPNKPLSKPQHARIQDTPHNLKTSKNKQPDCFTFSMSETKSKHNVSDQIDNQLESSIVMSEKFGIPVLKSPQECNDTLQSIDTFSFTSADAKQINKRKPVSKEAVSTKKTRNYILIILTL